MKNHIPIVLLFILALTKSVCSNASESKIEAYKSPFFVAQNVMVCGQVAQVSTKKKATYLNLDRAYPKQTLSIVIWNNKLDGFNQRFGDLTAMVTERVCVRGKITEYKNSLQVQVSNPQFLRLMK